MHWPHWCQLTFNRTVTNDGTHDSHHMVTWHVHINLKTTDKTAVSKSWSVKTTNGLFIKEDKGGVRKQEG